MCGQEEFFAALWARTNQLTYHLLLVRRARIAGPRYQFGASRHFPMLHIFDRSFAANPAQILRMCIGNSGIAQSSTEFTFVIYEHMNTVEQIDQYLYLTP